MTSVSAGSRWTVYAVVFILALIVRLVMIHVYHSPVANDLLWNDAVAWNLAQGHGFTASLSAPYQPAVFRSPGFPLFAAAAYKAFGHSYSVVHRSQAFLDAVTAAMVALIGLETIGLRVGLWSGVAYAMYPYAAAFCSVLHQDLLVTFFVTLMLVFTLRAQRNPTCLGYWFAIGLSLAGVALGKPYDVVCFLVPLAVVIHSKITARRILAAGSAALLAYSAIVGPWLLRNYREFHVFPAIATQGAENAASETVEELNIGENGIIKRMLSQPPATNQADYLAAFPEGRTAIRRDRYQVAAAIAEFERRWPEYLLLVIKHLPRLWVTVLDRWASPWVTFVAIVVSVAVLALGGIGMVLAWARRETLWPLFGLIAVMTLIYAPITVESRYTLPARPAMLVFVGIALATFWERIVARRQRPVAPAAGEADQRSLGTSLG